MNLEENGSLARPSALWKSPSEDMAPPKTASSRIRDKANDDAGEKLAAEMKVFNAVATELRAKRDLSQSAESKRRLAFETAVELFGVAPT